MRTITANYPGRRFPAVSVTGSQCGLGCDHCRGSFLKGMMASDPASLERDLGTIDVDGVMISGGCDAEGRLDLSGCTAAISNLTAKGMRVAVHAVLPTAAECRELAEAGVEVICMDLHGDEDVIRDVLHLNASAQDYRESLVAARDSGARVFPHVTVGLSRQDWEGALRMAAGCGVRELAILGLMSVAGTPLEGTEVSEEEMLEAFRTALNANLEPTLGCMRPRSLRHLERKLLHMGVRNFASPSRSTVVAAEEEGMTVVETATCCCISCTSPRG